METNNQEIIIKIINIDKWFGNFQALKNINLSVRNGQKIVICGPSGSGKSTIIRCINRLETHDSGQIFVDGIELNETTRNIVAVRREVGMVFQQFNLFPHLNVMDNLTLGPIRSLGLKRKDAELRAMKYLKRVHIPEQAKKFPNQLSGGQQQRVAIARSLCMEPNILLFDEPTSALDPEMISEVLDVIVELAKEGITMICVTHEMNFARRIADTMVFMDNGNIIEISNTDDFFTAPKSKRTKEFLNQILGYQ
jgi:ABC-type polar amino acid transport system ATPase subunit